MAEYSRYFYSAGAGLPERVGLCRLDRSQKADGVPERDEPSCSVKGGARAETAPLVQRTGCSKSQVMRHQDI